MSSENIGFIGGGQMARALAVGAVTAGLVDVGQLLFSEPSTAQRELLTQQLGKVQFAESREVLQRCERIVLAVKPQILKSIAADLAADVRPQHLLVSIAAGISLESLQQGLRTKRVIRVMPNTPCQVSAGASAIAVDANCSESDIAWVEKLLSAVGEVVRVSDKQMHAVTGLSGSGPAYIYLVIEALSDGGVAQGLPRDLATKLAAQTVLGAAEMVLKTQTHPGALKDQVTSPAGTTIAAIRELEKAGVRSAFIEAVSAATIRSQELG